MENEWHVLGESHSPEDTFEIAKRFTAELKPGDIVLLTGDLGAGKTRFVQGAAAALGAEEVPVSPTFNIVLTYESARMPIHHFDLYRLDSAEQLEDIGLREYLESDGVCFVEWAEKFPDAFDDYIALHIEKTSETTRIIRVAGEMRRADAPRGVPEGLPCPPREEQRVDSARRDAACSDRQPWPGGVADSAPAQVVSPSTDTRGDAVARTDAAGLPLVVALDTSNEVVAIGVGALVPHGRRVDTIASREIPAHRASNTTLVPALDALLAQIGASRDQIACVCVGRGPGSFTGVRIAMACAKGIASALSVGLVGVSTLDAIAWGAWERGVRGDLLVLADAMRKEVYPARFQVDDRGVRRLTADCVVKADQASIPPKVQLIGDALVKYRELYEGQAQVLSDKLWEVAGRGLLLALQAAWRAGEVDPLDAARHNPAFALPVYTRLSDAEENERAKLARDGEKDLVTGVQGRDTMHSKAHLVAPAGQDGVSYHPLDAVHIGDVVVLEREAMGTDAWNERQVASELGQRERSWWVAEANGALVGYAGGLVAGGELEILKVAVASKWRRHGIARELIRRVAEDARNLGASSCSLEVRASNEGAQALYEALGLGSVGTRPRYYSDREDALIMRGPLPTASRDVAGMELQHLGEREASGLHGEKDSAGEGAVRPLILAIESSCDETAAAIVDGQGALRSDVVASQIDFHARFGGVVPEIASRKHIEAICGVCEEALEVAHSSWGELDAVAVTYAPGLLGALVVGVAFAKGAAWALDVPFIGVNHLEGHLYANKIDAPDFEPPAVVSLVSGGNTMLVHMRGWGDYEVLGETIDDAVGEAFDKVAKALGLGYPGGPVISREAQRGNPDAIAFPRAMMHSHDLRFSLSGLKTAVVNHINGGRAAARELNIPDIAASFQQAVIDVQVAKAKAALKQTGAPMFCLGGGVAANPALRSAYEKMCSDMGVSLMMPPLSSCGDNAGMIALVALDRYQAGRFFALDADAQAHANLAERY